MITGVGGWPAQATIGFEWSTRGFCVFDFFVGNLMKAQDWDFDLLVKSGFHATYTHNP
jgi:hypothetical protein